ncbi:cyclin-P isoform X3 [Pelodiscus sinensis]|uniref:cyclin-P isoform X3 n=1 Tax=Pelodiscus sinensis TaxID=13735 RepID=UPI003F6CF861
MMWALGQPPKYHELRAWEQPVLGQGSLGPGTGSPVAWGEAGGLRLGPKLLPQGPLQRVRLCQGGGTREKLPPHPPSRLGLEARGPGPAFPRGAGAWGASGPRGAASSRPPCTPWRVLTPHVRGSRQLQAEEKREPLKSQNKGLAGDKGARKKKPQGNRAREAAPERAPAVCPRIPASPGVQRGGEPGGGQALLCVPEALAEELGQALVSMDMALEQEYAWDIFTSMLQKQSGHVFRSWQMPRAVTAEMRALVVDWLVQVHEYLSLADDTLYLAVYLMNAYMKVARVRVPALQLLSVTCLFVACKVEECTFPEPAELCFMTEDSFSRRELLRMERKVLSRLDFQLHYTNPVHLLQLLAALGRCPPEVHHLAMYFMELSLMEVDCVAFEPAQLAAAALCLAQRVLQEAGAGGSGAGPEGSMPLCLYSEAALGAVHHSMARAVLRAGASSLRATFLKYSRPQKLGTSASPAIAHSSYLARCRSQAP